MDEQTHGINTLMDAYSLNVLLHSNFGVDLIRLHTPSMKSHCSDEPPRSYSYDSV